MEYYKSFRTEALERYKSLPSEQSELYKRYFVNVPVDSFIGALENPSVDPEADEFLDQLAKSVSENLKIKFDVIIGSKKHIINNSDGVIKVENVEDLTEESFPNRMKMEKDDKLVAFIQAHSKKIIFINVPDNKKSALNLLFGSTKTPLPLQIMVKLGKNAELRLFELYGSKSSIKSMVGITHDVEIGEYSKSEINIVHNEDANTYVLEFTKGSVKANGHLKMNYVYNGGSYSRAKNEISSDGHNAKCEVLEMILGSGEQKFDLGTVVANASTDTRSELDSRAVLMDKSMCILKGFANIAENAKGANSFVNERGILLDKQAHMDSIPGMSIKNSNVKATHSSATAPVDEDSLFYLMSRGTDETTAKRLLVTGFFATGISKIENDVVKQVVASLLHEKITSKRFGTVPQTNIEGMWINKKVSDMFEGHYKYKENK